MPIGRVPPLASDWPTALSSKRHLRFPLLFVYPALAFITQQSRPYPAPTPSSYLPFTFPVAFLWDGFNMSFSKLRIFNGIVTVFVILPVRHAMA